jgi:hypothetical protein
MRRTALALLFASAGCIAGRSSIERDDRLLRELSRQERWAQQAIDARPSKEQLDRIRGGDFAAVGTARKELQKLILAVDRGTWMRDTAAELMKEDGDPQLAQEFDRGGRLRTAALQGADDVANALAETKGGLAIGDLKPGFEALHKAQASEDRLSRLAMKPGLRLAAAPLPAPRPFVEAAARLVDANPELAKELDRLPADDAARIRARLADLDRQKEELKHSEPAAVAIAKAAPPEPAPPAPAAEMEAQAPSNTLKIDKDALSLLAKKPPRAITLREDGLFGLSYDDGEYLLDPDGKLVRKEAPEKPAQSKR